MNPSVAHRYKTLSDFLVKEIPVKIFLLGSVETLGA
jgi:hypothetical protein